MFEHYRQPLISRSAFFKRMLICIIISLALLFFTTFIGASVLHYLGGFSWIDGILNAVSIMMGVGIIGMLDDPILKLTISFYAIFSGIVFFTVLMILFAPLVHRFLHRFHLDVEKNK
ncbi:MAG: hypothetical protein PHU91_00625 [Candidatus Omnitrophica bacterium]|nr:hypothetical protein [Candidatus Omnitrophota bacterium]MDD5236163.1 hypothetical protein [Candidatus Omnitrophota bacterium]MDD5610941.1 hypothetical protein [Candidatus Omnitrophota bacterium]